MNDKGGCYAAYLLEPVEHPLDAVALPVTPPVCFLWNAVTFS